MRRTPWLVALVVVLSAAATAAPPAHAQGDDWDVQRDPFDKSVVARLKGILARNPSDGDALAKLLNLYRRYRTVALLRTEYETALASKPDDFATLVVLGRLARNERDDATALTLFERAAAARTDAAVLVELGTLYRTTGKLADARTALDKAVATNPGKPVKMKALRALADLALAAKDIDGARGYFEQYIALEPGNVALRLELGDALVAAGKHDDAIAVYQDAEGRLGSDPARKVEVVARLGQAHEQKGDDAAAITTYRRAIKLVPRGYYLETELTARIVDIYRRKQDLATLLSYYEQEWPAARRGAFEWGTLARLYEETGDQDQAVTAYQKAVAKAPYELEVQRRLIQLLEATGRDDEALKQYEVVARVAPGEARFQLELAERYWRLHLEAKALTAAKQIEGRFPTDPAVMSAVADLYLRWNKEDLALAAFERLARLEPDDPDHLITLGEQYHQRGQVDKAMATWKRIAGTKSASGYARLGDVLAEHDAPTEGLVYYAKAIKLDPDNPELYKGRAQILERQRAFAEAMADWEKALTLWIKPSDRSARREVRTRIVNLLPRWDSGGHKDEYRARWERGFARTPPDLEAGYFLVAYYGRFGQQGQPRGTLERLLKLAPDDQETLLDLVKAYRAERAYDKAVALLVALAEKDPARQREAYNQIAEIKTEAHQDAEAIAWSQKALEKSPNDPVAFERLGARYVDMQRLDDAVAAYQRVIELDRRNWKAYFVLAALHQQRIEHTAAAELYRRILRQATDDDTLRKAGKAAIALEEINQSLGELEKVLAPLSSIMGHKQVYRQLLVELYVHYVPRLVNQARHGTREVSAAARVELVRLGHGGMKALLDALGDDTAPAQRTIAVALLGHLGNKAAALPLVRVAKLEPASIDPSAPRAVGTLVNALDLDNRIAALVAAGRLGDARVVPDVLALARHGEVGLREAAVFTLAGVDDARATGALLTALDDNRPSVSALACFALGGARDPRAVKAALAVTRDRDDLVRAACAAGLAGGGAAAVPWLTTAVVDNAGETQRLAAYALGQLGDARATAPLVRAYLARGGQDRRAIVWALGRVSGHGAATAELRVDDYPMRAGKLDLPTLIRGLPGELPATGPTADVIVGHEAAAADAVIAALGAHRDAALSALIDLDRRADGLALGELTDGALSAPAAAALRTIGERIAAAVVARTRDDDPKLAARAVSVAGKIGTAAARAALTAALADDRRLVREAAMQAIARPGGTDLTAALYLALRDVDWRTRLAAATAIASMGARVDVAALAAAAGDRSAFVRAAIATALGGSGGEPAIAPLLALSKDDTPEVRVAAARALRASSDPRARSRIAELAADPDPAVVRAAATAATE